MNGKTLAMEKELMFSLQATVFQAQRGFKGIFFL
jgi:hypothetical protein